MVVGDHRHDFLESLTVSVTIEAMSLQILNMSIFSEDFAQNTLLDLISVFSDAFNELEGLLVLLFQRTFWSFRHGFLFFEMKTSEMDFKVCVRERVRELEESDGDGSYKTEVMVFGVGEKEREMGSLYRARNGGGIASVQNSDRGRP